MYTGINEFKRETSITEPFVMLVDVIVGNNKSVIAKYYGHSDKKDITILCSYEDGRTFKMLETVNNLLNADTVKIYFDGELVLWVE